MLVSFANKIALFPSYRTGMRTIVKSIRENVASDLITVGENVQWVPTVAMMRAYITQVLGSPSLAGWKFIVTARHPFTRSVSLHAHYGDRPIKDSPTSIGAGRGVVWNTYPEMLQFWHSLRNEPYVDTINNVSRFGCKIYQDRAVEVPRPAAAGYRFCINAGIEPFIVKQESLQADLAAAFPVLGTIELPVIGESGANPVPAHTAQRETMIKRCWPEDYAAGGYGDFA